MGSPKSNPNERNVEVNIARTIPANDRRNRYAHLQNPDISSALYYDKRQLIFISTASRRIHNVIRDIGMTIRIFDGINVINTYNAFLKITRHEERTFDRGGTPREREIPPRHRVPLLFASRIRRLLHIETEKMENRGKGALDDRLNRVEARRDEERETRIEGAELAQEE